MRLKAKDIFQVFKITAKKWYEKDPFRESAVIAYYSVFSLPALLVLIITSAGFFFGAEAVSSHVFNQVTDTMGEETSNQIKEMLLQAMNTKTSLWATIIGITTLIVGATGVFAQLQKALNNIWEVKAVPQKGKNGIWIFLKTRLFSFGLILSIAFLLLISLVISTVIAAISDWMKADTSAAIMVLFHILNFIISLAVISTLFALIFKILPDAKIAWKHVYTGSVVTALLFMLGKTGLAYYFGKAEPGSGYGAAGSIILILLWVSYSSMIVFFGAEFTRAYADKRSGGVKPSEFAEKKVVVEVSR